LLSWRQHWAVR